MTPSRLLALLTLAPSLFAQEAEIALVNAKVWTVDPARPLAGAVAVRGGRILAVGSGSEIRRLVTPATRVVDCGGRLVLPGFIDNHTHFMSGGFQLQSVDLRHARSEEEFAALIGERARRFPARWITGGDWDHDNWPGGKLPTRASVDRVAPTTPVFVSRYDGHMSVANSRLRIVDCSFS